jgi:AcrR family transcriptional regulator
MPRRRLSAEESKDLIITEASRLVSEIGFDKTTIADIATACRFSSANVHRIFGTREKINHAIAGRKLTTYVAAARNEALRETGAEGRLATFVTSIFQTTRSMILGDKRVHQMVARAIKERWPVFSDHRASLLSTFREIIEYGQSRDEFATFDVEATSRALHVSSMRFWHPEVASEMQDQPDDCSLDRWIEFAILPLRRHSG